MSIVIFMYNNLMAVIKFLTNNWLFIILFISFLYHIYYGSQKCIKAGRSKILSYLITSIFFSWLWISVIILFLIIPTSYDLTIKFGVYSWLSIPLTLVLSVLYIIIFVYPPGKYYVKFEENKK